MSFNRETSADVQALETKELDKKTYCWLPEKHENQVSTTKVVEWDIGLSSKMLLSSVHLFSSSVTHSDNNHNNRTVQVQFNTNTVQQ